MRQAYIAMRIRAAMAGWRDESIREPTLSRPKGTSSEQRACWGASSAIKILLMLQRTKVSAIVLGPAGAGLVGLANNVVVMFSGLAAFGISDSVARQIAASRDEVGARLARRAIVLLSVTLALLGASLVLLFSGLLSAKLFEEPTHATLVVWLSVAVLFSILAGGQRAIVAGERRVDDLARLSIISGVISTAVGVMVLWLFGTGGIIAYVVSAPIVLFATESYLIGRGGAASLGVHPHHQHRGTG